MAKVRIGLVGTGQRGKAYVQELLKSDDVAVTALCDTNVERLDAFADELGLARDDVLRTTDLDALLAGDLVEGVVVAVPDRFHKDVAVRAFEAHKHVLIEKPMALSVADCKAIVRAQQASGRLLQIGFVLRHTPFYRKVKQIVDSGALGQIMGIGMAEYLSNAHGSAYMRRWHRKRANSGSFILAKCCHDLDMLMWLAGARARAVASFGDNNFFLPSKRPATHCSTCQREASCAYRLDPDFVFMRPEDQRDPSENDFDLCAFNDDKDIVDNQVCLLELDNDVRATFALELFRPQGSERTITIAGTEGYLDGWYVGNRIEVSLHADGSVETFDVSGKATGGHLGGDREIVADFVGAIRGERPPASDWQDGLVATVVGLAIEEARRERRVVEIDPADYALQRDLA